MDYKLFPGAVPTEYVLAIIEVKDDALTASLTTAGPAAEGADYIFVPIDRIPVPDALQLGVDTAARAGKPFFVRLDCGAAWDESWGNLER